MNNTSFAFCSVMMDLEKRTQQQFSEKIIFRRKLLAT